MTNKTGVRPLEFKILVEVDEVEEQKGGIYLPPSAREKQQYEMTHATLVAKGGMAFKDLQWGDEERDLLVPGCKVWIVKYAGSPFTHDRKKYRVCSDKDVKAILSEEVSDGK